MFAWRRDLREALLKVPSEVDDGGAVPGFLLPEEAARANSIIKADRSDFPARYRRIYYGVTMDVYDCDCDEITDSFDWGIDLCLFVRLRSVVAG